MKSILLVVDMQNDFITGALGTREAVEIVSRTAEKIRRFDGDVLYTRDTHFENYRKTQEGQKLPVPHCIKGTEGYELQEEIQAACDERGAQGFDKVTFGARELPEYLERAYPEGIASVTLVGLCTDICVISNALLLKAFFPEVPIGVDASCCAGVTPESHKNALEAMRMCQVTIENEA